MKPRSKPKKRQSTSESSGSTSPSSSSESRRSILAYQIEISYIFLGSTASPVTLNNILNSMEAFPDLSSSSTFDLDEFTSELYINDPTWLSGPLLTSTPTEVQPHIQLPCTSQPQSTTGSPTQFLNSLSPNLSQNFILPSDAVIQDLSVPLLVPFITILIVVTP